VRSLSLPEIAPARCTSDDLFRNDESFNPFFACLAARPNQVFLLKSAGIPGQKLSIAAGYAATVWKSNTNVCRRLI
jgi:hypothetical protein